MSLMNNEIDPMIKQWGNISYSMVTVKSKMKYNTKSKKKVSRNP